MSKCRELNERLAKYTTDEASDLDRLQDKLSSHLTATFDKLSTRLKKDDAKGVQSVYLNKQKVNLAKLKKLISDLYYGDVKSINEAKEEKDVQALAKKVAKLNGGKVVYDNTGESEDDGEEPEIIIAFKADTDINTVAKDASMKIEKLPYNGKGAYIADGKNSAKNVLKKFNKNASYILVTYNF